MPDYEVHPTDYAFMRKLPNDINTAFYLYTNYIVMLYKMLSA